MKNLLNVVLLISFLFSGNSMVNGQSNQALIFTVTDTNVTQLAEEIHAAILHAHSTPPSRSFIESFLNSFFTRNTIAYAPSYCPPLGLSVYPTQMGGIEAQFQNPNLNPSYNSLVTASLNYLIPSAPVIDVDNHGGFYFNNNDFPITGYNQILLFTVLSNDCGIPGTICHGNLEIIIVDKNLL